MDTKKIAENIFKETKKKLAEIRKYNKEGKGWRKYQMVRISYDAKNEYNKVRQKWVEKGFDIFVDDKKIAEGISYIWLNDIFRDLWHLVADGKKVKGWGGLVAVEDSININYYSSVKIVKGILLADAVCKEYKSLAHYISKYGNVDLGEYRLFSSRMGGKRGRLWDEYGERMFLDNKPKKCVRILDELRKVRGTKDIMTCRFGQENYIDEMERRHSEYYEVECEGEKRNYLEITIKTPSGRVKYQDKIF